MIFWCHGVFDCHHSNRQHQTLPYWARRTTGLNAALHTPTFSQTAFGALTHGQDKKQRGETSERRFWGFAGEADKALSVHETLVTSSPYYSTLSCTSKHRTKAHRNSTCKGVVGGTMEHNTKKRGKTNPFSKTHGPGKWSSKLRLGHRASWSSSICQISKSRLFGECCF